MTDSMQNIIEEFYAADDVDDWDSSMRLASQTIEQFPTVSTGWAMQARTLYKREEIGGARKALQKAQQMDAACPMAAWTEALMLHDEEPENYEATLAILDRALRAHPRHFGCLLGRGWLLSEKDDSQAAVDCYREAMDAAPYAQRPVLNAADTLDRLGRADEVHRLWEETAAKRPEDGMLAYNIGTRLFETGEYAKAIVHLDRARRLLGATNAVQHNRGLTLAALEHHEEAVEEWGTLLLREPDWHWPLFRRLKSLRALGRKTEAQADMQRLSGMSHLDDGVLWELSKMYQDDGETQKGIDCLRRMIEMGEGTALVYDRMAAYHFDLDNHEEAQALYEQALSLDPQDAWTHMGYAKVMLAQDEAGTALEHAEIAIALDPAEDAPQRRVRGEALVALERFEEALPELEGYFKTHRDYLPAIRALAEALMGLEHHQSLLTHCNTLIAADAADPWPQWAAARANAALNVGSLAIYHYEKARDLYRADGETEIASLCQKEIDALQGKKGLFSRLFGSAKEV